MKVSTRTPPYLKVDASAVESGRLGGVVLPLKGQKMPFKARSPRAGKRKCKRCKLVWKRPKEAGHLQLCDRCDTHCARCDIELTVDNYPDSNKRTSQRYCHSCTVIVQRLGARGAGRKEKARDWSLIKNFGITSVEYDEMLKEQGGVCWICQKPPKEGGRKLAVDHLHSKGEKKRNPREKRGRIRGLLCWACNGAIGKFRDDVTKLRRAADYLEQWPGQQVLKKEDTDE